MSNIKLMDEDILNLSDKELVDILLFLVVANTNITLIKKY